MDFETWARAIAHHLSNIVEMVAAAVVAVALIQFIVQYFRHLFHPNKTKNNRKLRVTFGSSLTIALELLLAADILATAIAPNWNDIGKLAAIAAIRTALNYFLEKELREINNENEATAKVMHQGNSA